MSDDVRANPDQPEPEQPKPAQPELEGPANDALEAEAAAAARNTFEQAVDVEPEGSIQEPSPVVGEDEATEPTPQPAVKLERLQKILAQAGVASRRHAEELITQGRVQVNGKVVTELGSKADAARDHIRVDGKLLQGSERHRYFMLNKPKGFVTTVSDPEGRATVMQFFSRMNERLYPVGRLDYMSEGLLLVTNDGDLANKLTRAAAGVEKTYLVKISGEPTEEELDRLREGVGIDRGKPGSGRVQTAPAQIRKVRQGDNPWYEVVIIEGRNRELRKMFEEIGHRVEKIRRVGYGPLVLDIEPGNMRELEPEELEELRKAADGKLRKPKDKGHRRNASKAQLPTLRPRERRPVDMPSGERPAFSQRREFPPKKQFGTARPQRPERRGGEGFRGRPQFPAKGPGGFGAQRSTSPQTGSDRPAWKKNDRSSRPPARFGQGQTAPPRRPDFAARPPRGDRPASASAGRDRSEGRRPFPKKPWQKPDSERRPFQPNARPPRASAPGGKSFDPPRSSRLQIEAVGPDQGHTPNPVPPFSARPGTRSGSARPPFRGAPGGRPGQGRRGDYDSRQDRPRPDRPKFERSGGDRPARAPGRPARREFGAGRPPRSAGDRSRPFTTSTGKPRAGGARPSSKRPGSSAGKPAWKPKSGSGRPASTGRSKPAFGSGPRPGGSSKSGYKGKSGGSRSGGPRPGGKRPGGRPGGKKRT